MTTHNPCPCNDPECWFWAPLQDSPYCQPCGEHHRAPECVVDTHGRALRPDGTSWDEEATA